MLSPVFVAILKKPLALMESFTPPAGSTSDATSYTFTSCPIGDPSAERLVIVAICLRDTEGLSPSSTTVTIGGIAATLLVSSNGSSVAMSWWSAIVPTGTTANIVTNTNSITCEQAALAGVFTLKNYLSRTPFGTLSTGAASPATGSIAIPTNGVVVASAILNANGSLTWNESVVEQSDFVTEAALTVSAAMTLDRQQAGSLTISATPSTSVARMAAVSFA